MVVLFIMAGVGSGLQSQTPAFPGAEGHGRYVTGGRGGRVIEVTNLEDSGTGSLRAAVEASGARTVVFRVSGTIRLESTLTIRNDSITIAGQTAPGDGITLRDYQVAVAADNVIIRFIRFRMGDAAEQEADALGGRFQKNIIIDHCSMSWSTDECVSFYQNEDFTLQWCLVAESLRNSVHDKGAHGYGGIWGGRRASFHHNLLAHHDSRNPRLGEYRGSEFALTDLVDLRNNVIYNWGGNSCYGGEAMNVNIVNCYYKPGPASRNTSRIVGIDKLMEHGYPISNTWGKFYINGNVLTASPQATGDNWTYGVYNQISSNYGILSDEEKEAMRMQEPHDPGEIITHSAHEAYELVMEHAGASLFRDTVDRRILHDVRTGTATVMDGGNGSTNGIIDTQGAVGGWPVLGSLPPPSDRDHDGMPDDWELARGLHPDDPDDRNGDRTGDGYTNLEEYLNSLVDIPWDLEPMLRVYAPTPGSGYLLEDTVFVKALTGVYGGGTISAFELFIDGELAVSTDSSSMDTLLTGFTPGSYMLTFRATDDRGNIATDTVKVFVGTTRYHLVLATGDGEGGIIAEPYDTGYVEGAEVALLAKPEFTYRFTGWSGDVSGIKNPLPLTISGEMEVIANFVRDTGTYARINFQPDDGDIPPGYLVDAGEKIGLRNNGLRYGWVGGNNLETIRRTGVDDPRKATFNQMMKNGPANWEIALPDGHYSVNVHLGDGRMTDQVNSLVVEGIPLTDTVENSYFDEFYLPSVEVNDGALTLVPAGENTKINFIKIGSEGWKFGRYLAVVDGTGDGDHPVGSVVEVRANPAGTDYTFLSWTGDTIFLADTRSAATTLTMPGQDVVLKAVYWEPMYSLVVNSGTGDGQYRPGSKVLITADVPPEGQTFSKWEVVAGYAANIANLYASFTWVTIPERKMEVTATYEGITGIHDPQLNDERLIFYPNPAREELYIEPGPENPRLLRLFDLTGRQVYSEISDAKLCRIDLRKFSPGLYHIAVSGEKGKVLRGKLIIE